MAEENFDKFVDELEKEIIEKEIKEYNEYIVNLYRNPTNWGKLPENDTTISHSYRGPCGDEMQFFLKINDGIIEKANFITDGCGASVATGCQTMKLIEGKPIDQAEKLTPAEIDSALQGLPDDHKHCAELAARTLKRTIEKYRNKLK